MGKKVKQNKTTTQEKSLFHSTEMQPGVVPLFTEPVIANMGTVEPEHETYKPVNTGKRPLSRKYYAYDLSRIAFWCKELLDKQYVTQHGPTIIAQETGFDVIVADLILCTSEQILECGPKGDIQLDDGGKVKDVKHYFYELSLARMVDKAYKILSAERAAGAVSYFIHSLAKPRLMTDGNYHLCSPKGAVKAGIAPLIDTEFLGVA